MTALPPRPRLAALLADLARRLPESHGILLSAPELAAGRAALEALADPRRRARVAAGLGDAEAAWLAQRIEAGWSRLGPVRRDPSAALVADGEVWLTGATVALALTLATDGLEPGWTAAWPDDVIPGAGGGSALLELPSDTAPGTRSFAVKVIGRATTAANEPPRRAVLVAETAVRLRRPTVAPEPEPGWLRVTDETGAPAAGLTLEVDGHKTTVPASGRVARPEGASGPPSVKLGGQALPIAEG